MKRDVEINKIDGQEFQAALNELGIKPEFQVGFVKVSGAEGRAVYISKTKRVARVDLYGFEVKMKGVINLEGLESFGNVKQQLDFTQSPKDIIETFKKVVVHMKTLGPVEHKRRSPTASPDAPKGWTVVAAAEQLQKGLAPNLPEPAPSAEDEKKAKKREADRAYRARKKAEKEAAQKTSAAA